MSRPDRVRRADFALFAALYAIQGVVAAYFLTFNPIYLAAVGIPRRRAADVQSLALLPFVLKFLAGPFSDRFSLLGLGHRKPYIVLGLIVQSLALTGLALVDPPRHLAAFTALAVLAVTGLALYDTCCDGLVIDVTPDRDRARVQGTLVAARALAAMFCSYGFGSWIEAGEATAGGAGRYRMLLGGCAAIGVIPLLMAIPVHEPAGRAGAERFRWSALRVLLRPDSLWLLAYGGLYATIAYGVEINLGPFYHALGFGAGTIGALGSLRYVGRALGGALLPLAGPRLGLGPGAVLVAGVAALAVGTAGQAAVHGPRSAAAGAIAFGLANGWSDALFFVLAMKAADPRMAASTYALFMAVTNLSVLGGSLFARADLALGGRYRPTFLAAAIVNLALLWLVPRLSGTRASENNRLQSE